MQEKEKELKKIADEKEKVKQEKRRRKQKLVEKKNRWAVQTGMEKLDDVVNIPFTIGGKTFVVTQVEKQNDSLNNPASGLLTIDENKNQMKLTDKEKLENAREESLIIADQSLTQAGLRESRSIIAQKVANELYEKETKRKLREMKFELNLKNNINMNNKDAIGIDNTNQQQVQMNNEYNPYISEKKQTKRSQSPNAMNSQGMNNPNRSMSARYDNRSLSNIRSQSVNVHKREKQVNITSRGLKPTVIAFGKSVYDGKERFGSVQNEMKTRYRGMPQTGIDEI
ncbi:MAG: hypothetical protein EZS28_017644 [Streblomastix strix]|uniref:Uncharacterized protein n=1 Tax=Streblomastix strix TaxID=222440 RepID=A0A5J4VWF5_9EUKA|nr:MAG: hypothetical protein EZS28_017644 [Streblomastix strix]